MLNGRTIPFSGRCACGFVARSVLRDGSERAAPGGKNRICRAYGRMRRSRLWSGRKTSPESRSLPRRKPPHMRSKCGRGTMEIVTTLPRSHFLAAASQLVIMTTGILLEPLAGLRMRNRGPVPSTTLIIGEDTGCGTSLKLKQRFGGFAWRIRGRPDS